jgi:hypothetical protein
MSRGPIASATRPPSWHAIERHRRKPRQHDRRSSAPPAGPAAARRQPRDHRHVQRRGRNQPSQAHRQAGAVPAALGAEPGPLAHERDAACSALFLFRGAGRASALPTARHSTPRRPSASRSKISISALALRSSAAAQPLDRRVERRIEAEGKGLLGLRGHENEPSFPFASSEVGMPGGRAPLAGCPRRRSTRTGFSRQ